MEQFFTLLRLRLAKAILKWRMTRKGYLVSILNPRVIDPAKGLEGLPAGAYRSMAYTRAEEVQHSGPFKIVADGNSRFHFGEGELEKIPGLRVLAIGGATTETNWVQLPYIAGPAKPVIYITDICGNDALNRETLDTITRRLFQIFAYMLANGVKKIGWVTPCATGNPGLAPAGFRELAAANTGRFTYANALFLEIIKAVQDSPYVARGLVDVLDVRKVLMGPDGFMQEWYCAPDRIHHTTLAYVDAYNPVIDDFINRNKVLLEV